MRLFTENRCFPRRSESPHVGRSSPSPRASPRPHSTAASGDADADLLSSRPFTVVRGSEDVTLPRPFTAAGSGVDLTQTRPFTSARGEHMEMSQTFETPTFSGDRWALYRFRASTQK